ARYSAKWGLIFAIQAKPFAAGSGLSPAPDTRIFAAFTQRRHPVGMQASRPIGQAFHLASKVSDHGDIEIRPGETSRITGSASIFIVSTFGLREDEHCYLIQTYIDKAES
ncbi:hypothetical protein, partial [Sphingopyxis sp.]|uniref:hypothetical protein n=1 Tax=Sphingopyxis sp. TaxID=1908224 RepID=UPI002610FF78